MPGKSHRAALALGKDGAAPTGHGFAVVRIDIGVRHGAIKSANPRAIAGQDVTRRFEVAEMGSQKDDRAAFGLRRAHCFHAVAARHRLRQLRGKVAVGVVFHQRPAKVIQHAGRQIAARGFVHVRIGIGQINHGAAAIACQRADHAGHNGPGAADPHGVRQQVHAANQGAQH